MSRSIRIGNAQAFWGDRDDAAAELLWREPDMDYLTMDYLAEVSMSILAAQRRKDPAAGFPRDFLSVIESIAGYWINGGQCKLITNAGGLDPLACGKAVAERLSSLGCNKTVAVVTGDDCLDQLASAESGEFRHLETNQPIELVQQRLVTANAYTGIDGVIAALADSHDIVITGRIADPSMVLAACVHEFGWSSEDYDRLAGGTLAGHLLECGTHLTGGISTDWDLLPSNGVLSYPIVEINEDGSCVATKARGTGGVVDSVTVREQILYEVLDPTNYISPDVCVSLEDIGVEQDGDNRVRVSGVKGARRPDTLKVTATYTDGFRVSSSLTIVGRSAVAKATRVAEIVHSQLVARGVELRNFHFEVLGTGDSVGRSQFNDVTEELFEVVLRISAESDDSYTLGKLPKLLISAVTAGPQGTTGYADGRSRVKPIVRYWPCLIDRDRAPLKYRSIVQPVLDTEMKSVIWPPKQFEIVEENSATGAAVLPRSATNDQWRNSDGSFSLGYLCHARSGDKGTGANVGIIARSPEYFDWLDQWLTEDTVASHFARLKPKNVQKFSLANISSMNFLIDGILQPITRNDSQGKALGQSLLELVLPANCPFFP